MFDMVIFTNQNVRNSPTSCAETVNTYNDEAPAPASGASQRPKLRYDILSNDGKGYR